MLQHARQLFNGRQISHTVKEHKAINRAFHTRYDPTREEQTCTLSDGRKIGFAEYGDLQGTPAFFLHGSPGSRYDGWSFIDIAKKLNVRIISPDRPGHGLSTFQPNRKLGDYPKDISQLARYLGIAKYHVFGISGGGPYAVACAHGSPKDEILTASVIAGMGHPDVLTVKDDGWYTVTLCFLAKRMPSLLRFLMNSAIQDEKKMKEALNKIEDSYFTKEEKEYFSDPEIRTATEIAFREAYAQGPDGALRDCQIYAGPWDFELQDVQTEVKLFFGLKDNRAPFIVGRHLKEHLPKAELVEFDNMTHFNTYLYDEEIFRRILGTWEPPAAPDNDVGRVK